MKRKQKNWRTTRRKMAGVTGHWSGKLSWAIEAKARSWWSAPVNEQAQMEDEITDAFQLNSAMLICLTFQAMTLPLHKAAKPKKRTDVDAKAAAPPKQWLLEKTLSEVKNILGVASGKGSWQKYGCRISRCTILKVRKLVSGVDIYGRPCLSKWGRRYGKPFRKMQGCTVELRGQSHMIGFLVDDATYVIWH